MRRTLFIIATALCLCSCRGRIEPVKLDYDRVAILYSVGRNSIGYYLKEDIEEMCSGESGAYIPEYGSRNALLIISHQTKSSWQYGTPTEPVLINVHRDRSGSVLRDTVFRMSPECVLTDGKVMKTMLEKARELFPTEHCGLVLSSHGSGWLPNNYFDSGEMTLKSGTDPGDYDSSAIAFAPGRMTYSFGQEIQADDKSYMMNIPELAENIPYHLDYMLFDACLMGNIETLFELRDCADAIGVSATEILADGFNYLTLARRLLEQNPPSPQDVCEDYFDQYASETGAMQSATIALIDCSGLDNLAGICRVLFDRYRDGIGGLQPSDVQRFFRYDDPTELLNRGWFYDLLDIMDNAGISASDRAELSNAIDKCVKYKANTPKFLSEFEINSFCGIGMAIPQFVDDKLKAYYTELDWNKATGLVK